MQEAIAIFHDPRLILILVLMIGTLFLFWLISMVKRTFYRIIFSLSGSASLLTILKELT